MATKDRMLPQEQEVQTPVDMSKRQSAPRPTAQDYAASVLKTVPEVEELNAMGMDKNGAIDGFRALEQPIGREQIHKAQQTLQKYKEGKANLERKIVDNEQWYKLRHWESMRMETKREHDAVEPASAWLFQCIEKKLADMMDNYPAANFLPREEGDKDEAKMLSSIVPVILDENHFKRVYQKVCRRKLKTGTGAYGVFWSNDKLNGLGDVSITPVDIINLFWEPGISDIQNSHNVFHVELKDNDDLLREHPQLQGKLGTSTVDVTKYIYDDSVDTSNMSAVVDWYYKKKQNGRTVLHYAKFVNDEVLFATENTEEYRDRGWYDHAKYPFVFDVLFPAEGTPAGFGYIDIGKSPQEYIDRGNAALMKSLLFNASPRFFIRNDGSVNEEEYNDLSKHLIHVDGNLGNDSITPVGVAPVSEIYVAIINNKIEELKETTGNRDISNGGSASGVTAASAIAAMQEAGSALSRLASSQSYDAFEEVCKFVLELIRQFYDLPRQFRITGENGNYEFVNYSNQGIIPQEQGNDFGVDMGYRLPEFDIIVSAQKQSPYSKMSQNELALQFYGAGFFNPQQTDQALATLEMMDFDRKEFIMQKIAQNGGMFQQMIQMQQQMLMLAQMVDQSRGTNIADQIAAGITGQQAPPMVAGSDPAKNVDESEALGGENKGEATNTKKAREATANMTNPT